MMSITEQDSAATWDEHWHTPVAGLEAWHLSAPIQEPVVTSFGAMQTRPALLIRLRDRLGVEGLGEAWCNFPSIGASYRLELIEKLLAPLLQSRRHQLRELRWAALWPRLQTLAIQAGEIGPFANIAAAFDLAAHDLVARRAGVPLARLLSGSAGSSVPVYASGIHPTQWARALPDARRRGIQAFKLKVGFDDAADLASAGEASVSLRAGETFMLDANQRWSPEQAAALLPQLAALGPAWVEEPILASSSASQWRALTGRAGCPIAGGENLWSAEDFSALRAAGVRYLQPDLCKWGGISACAEVAAQSQAQGALYCPHFLGAGVGLAASAHLLAARPGGWLEVDWNENPLRTELVSGGADIVEGRYLLADCAGLGIELRPQALARFTVARLERAL